MKTPYYPLFHILKWLCRQEQTDEIEQAKILVYNKIVQEYQTAILEIQGCVSQTHLMM